MRILSLIPLFLFLINALQGQTTYIDNVKVEYEKVVYARQFVKELWGEDNFDRWGAHIPQQLSYFYDYTANKEKSVYKQGRETQSGMRGWWDNIFGSRNTVSTDFTAKKLTAVKPVFEETFLVEDTTLTIKWKITADTRIIAGFECRKAIGILNDSIGIFAFYTDEILVTGGPESIHGLPGLILGMGIPRLHSTWFATKVVINTGAPEVPAIPKKAKKTSYEALTGKLHSILSNFGSEGSKLAITFAI